MTTRPAAAPIRLVAVALAALALLAPAARAQDDESLNELRRDNDRLRQRIDALEARLAEQERENLLLRDEVERLLELVRELEDRAASPPPSTTAPGGAPADPDEPPATPSVDLGPLSSPPALLEALREHYTETLPEPPAEQRDTPAYIRDVRRWARAAEREFRGGVEWVIAVLDPNPATPDEAPIRFRVVDPATGAPLHDEHARLVFPRRAARTIHQNSGERYWIVRGAVEARPRVNVERTSPGLFDFPAYIGLYAEFEYSLDVRSIRPFRVGEGDGADDRSGE